MARRERTTGLPRRTRTRAVHTESRRIAGITWNEQATRFAILGAILLLALGVLGAFAYRVYANNIGRPNTTVLNVDGDKSSLRYYADRLGPFAFANRNTGASLAAMEEDLLNKLEREALTIRLARESNIDLSDKAVLQAVANQLQVPTGGAAFDGIYKAELDRQNISDSTFRRLKRAELADTRLLDNVKAELGTAGEQYTLRTIVTASKEEADALVTRLKAGEEFGTVAQTASKDLTSRQRDGLMLPEPIELLPANIQAAVKDKPAGSELLGPTQVGTDWWIFKVERKDSADYSDAQKEQLARVRVDARIKAKRDELVANRKIKRDLSAASLDWAQDHLELPDDALTDTGAPQPQVTVTSR